MKEDLLFDALSEIEDKHIEEAATFEPKAKVLTTKRILTAAACVAVVAVSALAISGFTPLSTAPTTTTPTLGAFAAVTSTTNKKQDEADTYLATAITQMPADTEIATEIGQTEIYMETTGITGALVAPSWEDRHITSKFSITEVNGKRYTSCGMEAEYENLERVLGYVELTGRDYHSDKTYKTTVITYKLKDFSDDLFIAVKFDEDDNFYVYDRGAYKPEDVKDFLSDTSFEKYASKGEDYQIFHEVRGPVVSSVMMSDSTDEIITALVELLKRNPDVKAYESPYEDTNDHVSFGFRLKEYDCHAHFNENGRLTLSIGGFYYFDFSEEDYDEFIKLVEKNEKGKPLSTVTEPSTATSGGTVTTPAVPPAVTDTEPATELPDGVVTSSGYNPDAVTTAAPPYTPSTSEDISIMP